MGLHLMKKERLESDSLIPHNYGEAGASLTRLVTSRCFYGPIF